MCDGIFTEECRPVVYARVYHPGYSRQSSRTPPLEFLVDTGAPYTILNVPDALKLGISYQDSQEGLVEPWLNGNRLERVNDLLGIGGSGVPCFALTEVCLVFRTIYDDVREYHVESLPLLRIPEGKVGGRIPNIVGWDILQRFSLNCSPVNSQVRLSRERTAGSYLVEIRGASSGSKKPAP